MPTKFDSEMPMFFLQQAFAEFSGKSLRMCDSFQGISREQVRVIVSVLGTVAADLRTRNAGTQFEAEAKALADRIARNLNRVAEHLAE